MAGLPDELQKRCRSVLLRCSELDSDAKLRAVFVTDELHPFQSGLPEAASKRERVDACLAYLLERCLSDGRSVLPLFLAALRDRYESGDALRDELGSLVQDVEAVLGLTTAGRATEAPATEGEKSPCPEVETQNGASAMKKIHGLAVLMRQRNIQNEEPYVLVLGTRASLASGDSSTAEVVTSILAELNGSSTAEQTLDESLAAFFYSLDGLSRQERCVILTRYLKELRPPSGYHHLAALMKSGYFDIVLTTGFDLFLESALPDAGLGTEDTMILVNGQDRNEEIIRSLNLRTPRIKVLKLHGDLQRRSFAFTPSEVAQLWQSVEPILTQFLDKDAIVVGHYPRDEDLSRHIQMHRGGLWYVNASAPSPASPTREGSKTRSASLKTVLGGHGAFDAFFAWLRLNILLLTCPTDSTEETEVLEYMVDSDSPKSAVTAAGALERLGRRYADIGQDDAATVCYDRSIAIYASLGDHKEQARMLRLLGNHHSRFHRPEKAWEAYMLSLQIAGGMPDSLQEALSQMALGRWWWLARRSLRRAGKDRIRRWCIEEAVSAWERCLPALKEQAQPEAAQVEDWLRVAKETLESIPLPDSEYASQARLVVLSGPMDGAEWPVFKSVTTIGRNPDQDICLADDDTVAGSHARLVLEDDQYWLEETDSSTGLYLEMNGKQIEGQIALQPDSVFRVGPSTSLKLVRSRVQGEEFRAMQFAELIEQLLEAVPADKAAILRHRLAKLSEEAVGRKHCHKLLQVLNDLVMLAQEVPEGKLSPETAELAQLSTFVHQDLSDILNAVIKRQGQ